MAGAGTARTSLLVIGAGPYGVAISAHARARGIDTRIVGRPMALWREHMPAGMFLRSGPDWHLDADGVHTFQAFLDARGIAAADIDPIPIDVFLAYAAWFVEQTRLAIQDEHVVGLRRVDGGFEASLANGAGITADAVVVASGLTRCQRLPEWAGQVPPDVGAHTSDVVDFSGFRDRRVLVVGGRQSAYEWAALASDHGAARVDLVHRHDTPRFARVSWAFVDDYIAQTLRHRGWWRRLPVAEQQGIARRFWEVGRLTLEPWLPPRLPASRVRRWPNESVETMTTSAQDVTIRLASGASITADAIIFATGYAPNLDALPFLAGVVGDIARRDGFPVLDEGFQSSVPGLYFTGFAATRDFGPFFGFTKGCPAAATILVEDVRRGW